MLLDAHPGYITWAQFEANQGTLAANDLKVGLHAKPSLAREGPALLQGLTVCGKCGRRMGIHYAYQAGKAIAPVYVCNAGREYEDEVCQRIPGDFIDKAISQLIIATMTPLATQMALCVHAELQTQQDQADLHRRRQLERAEREVELARQRYLLVDPGNRHVAATLEADWNERLRDLESTRAEVERQRRLAHAELDQAARDRLDTLSGDFQAVWTDPQTPQRERKRLLSLLIEDVTLRRVRGLVDVHVRFRGGTTHSQRVAIPKNINERRSTHPQAKELIAQWPDMPKSEIAERLNALGYRGGGGGEWTAAKVQYIKWAYRLGNVRERVRPEGYLSGTEMTELLAISQARVMQLRKSGEILAERPGGYTWSFLPLDRQPEAIRLRAEKIAKLRAEQALDAAEMAHMDGV